jgi:uncharacterized protein YndB with AHSA1/START domain
MTPRSADHATFTIERRYPATPAEVYAAWTKPGLKRRWFSCHDDWTQLAYSLDARIGGLEISQVVPPGEEVHAYEARYLDVVPASRLVYAYTMHLGERLISISLATVMFEAAGAGTVMRFTEQAVFVDGYDGSDREHGTSIGLDQLGAVLRGER